MHTCLMDGWMDGWMDECLLRATRESGRVAPGRGAWVMYIGPVQLPSQRVSGCTSEKARTEYCLISEVVATNPEMSLQGDDTTTTDMASCRSRIDFGSPSPTSSDSSTLGTSGILDTLNTPCTSSTSSTHDDSSTSSTDTPSTSSSFDASSISSEGTNNSASEGVFLEPSSASSDPSSAVWKSYSLSDTSLLRWFQYVFTLVCAIMTACLCWIAQGWREQAKELQMQARELQKQLNYAKDESADLRRALERERKRMSLTSKKRFGRKTR